MHIRRAFGLQVEPKLVHPHGHTTARMTGILVGEQIRV